MKQQNTQTRSPAGACALCCFISSQVRVSAGEQIGEKKMNWKTIKRFNFTYAIPGGAWLEDSSGYVNWESFVTIEKQLGRVWIDRQLRAQGWMTGCWIDAVAV